ncbi:ABC transporter substrate-binding protein [Myxococcus llanfairpwllgwyngyllgogerychwyrndrobwllllantysiliogogogochensis]|uniref:ABC transporter substrate-binding protein n=1 Tax=Myxococcus llanfairpwllgwyngyllgogerychwyrndrobwllllantysiliogogogochensis TaxID=2590453 RepID=A0A540WXZ1_9BACT|nr:ABC transporter substrate-binding protein [Myxococcus llanfairpwllgwyngyllgogerychwyrndrobwllllantysiliogogogochensis]TQF13877.1 ABC transporter substrate-binding protein [Myxococcus llanfairpwllgwyngyllgogerychwyrndrobwllllantysiliogogogochensis]
MRPAGLVTSALLLLLCAACSNEPRPRPPGTLFVSVEQQSAWVRNFNPLFPGAGSRWPTRAGVYECLELYTPSKGDYQPWLATGHAWSEDRRTLRFTLREGVRWSDGKPFTAEDVAYTFQLLRKHAALDAGGVWRFLADVRAEGPLTVAFQFSRTFIPGFGDLAAQPIIPRHIWEQVADPVTFTNPNPVATGPFTQVSVFRNQVYELSRNPYYWQPGKPAVRALRFLAFPTNDQANLALVEGEVDWAGNFVPAVDRTFVARDPKHHARWFPLFGSTVFLYPNTTQPPLNDVRVRKALSMALDRERLVEIAMYGYTRPADATGLNDAYTGWRDADVADDAWVRHDAKEAARLLDEAGLTRGPDGLRRQADGSPLTLDIEVVGGWSDWVRAGQVVARDLRKLGLQAQLRTYEFSAWQARLQKGEFQLAISWSLDGPTPYTFYKWMLSSATVRPVGEVAPANWQRYGDKETDALLERFEVTDSREEQQALMAQVQRRFSETAPAIPLFPNPSWGESNSKRFTGFPTEANPYARLSPHAEPDSLLVLTALAPREAP